MTDTSLDDLQRLVRDGTGFTTLADYLTTCLKYLAFVNETHPTRIISPSHHNYIFYQYSKDYSHRITRPLNADLFIESEAQFKQAFERFILFLADLKRSHSNAIDRPGSKEYIQSKEINKVVYTLQQALGGISDSFDSPNQSRKRVGQLFEVLIKLIIQEVGLVCEPRTIKLPIPGYPGYVMSYQLDLVFSHNQAIVSSETTFIHASEIVGSVKTTSKDRIDKIFLDKHLLVKLLGRDIPVIAIFLHDVQRAIKGNTIFGINSTFKTNHFLGYTVALNRLDGVYYVDPRPEMMVNDRLRQQIRDFQQFLISDLWTFSHR
jgi:hypothetical protein